MILLFHAALASALPAPDTTALEQRTWGSGITVGAAFTSSAASETDGLQAKGLPVQSSTRIQLTRALALDPQVSFRLPRAKNWRVAGELGLRYYPASIGAVHVVVLGALKLGGGAIATPAPLEQQTRFLALDVYGGGGLEWTISPAWSLGVQARYAGATVSRHWIDGSVAKSPADVRSLEARSEVHRWF